ncbi:MAG: aspartate ammonia-lyase [Candidatus Omnitrophica bacterium]|nr:aspartate ammonia-lyase [Candidatus Omnitrophota bacterium]
MEYRVEHDLLGELSVPAACYWGIHTERARRNFSAAGRPVHAALIRAGALVKQVCADTNAELGFLPPEKASYIGGACREIVDGKWSDQFVVDALQGGAGTSTHMNLNEVIANRALELAGRPRGDYGYIHPLAQVNLHQSTNDVLPTALKIAAIRMLNRLEEAIAFLQGAMQSKEKEFAGIVKIGRTELQEAVPITLGAEFSGFADALSRDRWRTCKCKERMRVVNIGGTAVGTGLTAPRSYIFLVNEKLRAVSGAGITRGENLVGETANSDACVEVSGVLNACAQNFIKIANDLRLLHFLGEIRLPPAQAGSSLMPGKVNPVVCEAVIQAGIYARAQEGIVSDAASRATLQINEFLPLLADALLQQLDALRAAAEMLRPCVEAIDASRERCQAAVERSVTIITAFLPLIGYDRATELVREFRNQAGGSFRTFLAEKLGEEAVAGVLSADRITALGYREDV